MRVRSLTRVIVLLGAFAAVYILAVAHIEAVKSRHTTVPNQDYSKPDIDFGALMPNHKPDIDFGVPQNNRYTDDPESCSWANGSGSCEDGND